MGRKRKLPFGYRMQQGRVVVHTEEEASVKKLYDQYLQGASMRELLAHMQKSGAPYGEGMAWNLNRISRLLSDGRYVGKGSYPAIITQEVFETVTQWSEEVIRQIVHTVRVISVDLIQVILYDGTQIDQQV